MGWQVKTADVIWTVEDSKKLVLTLDKVNQMEWWKCVIVGDPEINTRKVPRAPRSLSPLRATRALGSVCVA